LAAQQARAAKLRAQFERPAKIIAAGGLGTESRENYDARALSPLSEQGGSPLEAEGDIRVIVVEHGTDAAVPM
jgi:hypothetical protein